MIIIVNIVIIIIITIIFEPLFSVLYVFKVEGSIRVI